MDPQQNLQKLGPYRIQGLLGQGGMGIVYRGLHEVTGQPVALKTIRGRNERTLQGLRREIHALSRLRHPGIVRVLETGLEDGLPWMAMELIPGQTLQSFKAVANEELTARDSNWAMTPPAAVQPTFSTPSSPTDLQTVLTLVRRLCSPLGYLHGEGIVHGDLKPQNVLLRAEPREASAETVLQSPSSLLTPVLVDFGLMSRSLSGFSREILATSATAGGTLAYMAPERLQGQPPDARADLYALGCILYELLTGRPPFVGPTNAEILQGHLESEPLAPSDLAGPFPDALDDLVLRLLEKRPHDRLGYADHVAEALGRLGAEPWPGELPTPRPYLYRPSFFGRHALLAQLERHVARLQSGQGSIVLLGGESGSGKTRLLLELARARKRQPMRVLSGECLPTGTPSPTDTPSAGPLHALRRPLQAIADRCRELGPAETERLLGPRAKLLARYEGSLADVPTAQQHPDPRELPAEAARLRLNTALEETFAALADPAAGPPLLLILDDLQWADELTLGFLRHLLQPGRILRLRLMLLGSFRTEEASAALDTLAQSPQADAYRLDGLEESAVEALVAEMLALQRPPWWLSAYLSHTTEGNPFFVAELLRSAIDAGLLHRDPQGRWKVQGADWEQAIESGAEALRLPRSVRELIERRLELLPAEARFIAETLSVLGREAELSLLARAAGAPRTQHAPLLEALGELIRRQVLEEPEPGLLRFVHDQLREVTYQSIPEDRLRERHRSAAQAIELQAARTGDRDEQLAALARHWEAAGALERAQDEYLAAARRASHRASDQEAERLCRAGLRLAQSPSKRSIEARHELVKHILEVQGRHPEAMVELFRLLDEARQLGDRNAEGMALRGLGRVNWALGRIEEAEALLEEALAVTRQSGDLQGEGRVLGNLGVLHAERGNLERGRQLLEQALSLSASSRDESAAAVALDNLAGLHADQGRPEQAEPLFQQALTLQRALGRRRLEGHTLGNLAILLRSTGRLAEARPLYEQALGIAREVGHRRLEGSLLADLGTLCSDEGRPEAADGYFEQALVLLRELRTPQSLARALTGQAAHRRRGYRDLQTATRLASEAVRLAEASGDLLNLGLARCELGHQQLARGASAQPLLQQIHATIEKLHAGPGSELGRANQRLQRASAAAQQGTPLDRGELPDDLPDALRPDVGD